MALYDAFISYSHAKDKPIAAALQSVVQKLGKPWYRRRALRVFRDDTSLSATPTLWPSIVQALEQSRFLILLASPEAAKSHWVGKEVAHWLELGREHALLVALTDGELAWDEAAGDFAWSDATPLPECLKGRFAVEPKWIDARSYREAANPRDAKFTEVAADFAAAVRGIPKEDLLSQELRQQRRALTLAWSATGSLLVLAGAAAWQWKEAAEQKQIAEAQTVIAKSEATRAERNFGAAKETVDSVILDLVEGLKNIEGMRVETVRRLLERAEAAIAQLASRTENDPAVRRSQAVMFQLFADTYSRLGATRLAADYAGKALALTRALAAEGPENLEWQRDVSVSLNGLGDILWSRGDLAGALAAHREALGILRALTTRYPGGLRRDIAVTLSKIGDVLAAQGDRTGALVAYREGLEIARMLSGERSDNLEWQRDVSVGLNKIGDMLSDQGALDGALAAYREGLAIRRALAAKDDANLLWQHDVVVSLNRIGETLVAQKDRTGALAAFHEGLGITRKLAARDPGNTTWQTDMALSLEKVGDVLAAEGNRNGALAAYRESLAIRRALLEKDLANAEWRRNVSLSLGRVADMLLAEGDSEGALAAYRETLAIRRTLATSDPRITLWQIDMVQALVKLAIAADDPRGRWTEVLAILKRLDGEGRLTPFQKTWIKLAEEQLSKIAQAGGGQK
jgi:tetratricopeptide (TPR) repeat protein